MSVMPYHSYFMVSWLDLLVVPVFMSCEGREEIGETGKRRKIYNRRAGRGERREEIEAIIGRVERRVMRKERKTG